MSKMIGILYTNNGFGESIFQKLIAKYKQEDSIVEASKKFKKNSNEYYITNNNGLIVNIIKMGCANTIGKRFSEVYYEHGYATEEDLQDMYAMLISANSLNNPVEFENIFELYKYI